MLNDKKLEKLRSYLRRLDIEGLRKRATERAVDISADASRDQIEAAIEAEALKQAQEKAADKSPGNTNDNANIGGFAAGDPLDDEQISSIQKIWALFSRNVPFAAHSQGVWEIEKDKRKDAVDHGVPDGDYRVLGADWILTFRGGRFVQATKGTAATRSDSYSNVPVQDAKL